MACCGLVLLSPPLVPSGGSPRDVLNVGWNSHGWDAMGGSAFRLVRLENRRGRPCLRASAEDNSDNQAGLQSTSMSSKVRTPLIRQYTDAPLTIQCASSTTSTSEKDELNAKLAAAEAESKALRKELAARKGSPGAIDLSKMKPATPEKRIDGTGYRETLFSGPSKTAGRPEQQSSNWGLSEAELFLSKGAPTEGSGLGMEAMGAGSEGIVARRLIIGVGITALAVGLANLKFPTGRPSKPLFVYLVSILQLQRILKSLEDSALEVGVVKSELRKAGSSGEIKNTLLSAAAWLDGEDGEKASKLAFEIYEYVDQADCSRYFENLGEPNAAQQMEFLKFCLQSIEAAREKVDEFLALVPKEALEAAAASQFAR